jgi:hypothetical protein
MWPVRHKVNYFGFDDANISYLCELQISARDCVNHKTELKTAKE